MTDREQTRRDRGFEIPPKYQSSEFWAEKDRSMTQQQKRKEMLAQALRDYPTWGDAYIAEKQRAEELSRVLLNVEGTLLAYWTDIPEAEVEQLRVLIRETLGDYEPHAVDES